MGVSTIATVYLQSAIDFNGGNNYPKHRPKEVKEDVASDLWGAHVRHVGVCMQCGGVWGVLGPSGFSRCVNNTS